jgi:hypothetical protein
MSTPLTSISTKGTKDIYRIMAIGEYEIAIQPENAYIISCTPTVHTNVIMHTSDPISGNKTIDFRKNPVVLGEILISISVSHMVGNVIIELVKVATLK